ncbi:hypothetical protein C8R46DRAFT_1226965 [Mycena filopes]|nr:hypothetical protein C8R46DRAFT_1226965 [Mycena filopes]
MRRIRHAWIAGWLAHFPVPVSTLDIFVSQLVLDRLMITLRRGRLRISRTRTLRHLYTHHRGFTLGVVTLPRRATTKRAAATADVRSSQVDTCVSEFARAPTSSTSFTRPPRFIALPPPYDSPPSFRHPLTLHSSGAALDRARAVPRDADADE